MDLATFSSVVSEIAQPNGLGLYGGRNRQRVPTRPRPESGLGILLQAGKQIAAVGVRQGDVEHDEVGQRAAQDLARHVDAGERLNDQSVPRVEQCADLNEMLVGDAARNLTCDGTRGALAQPIQYQR
jgi:hypothetical protein